MEGNFLPSKEDLQEGTGMAYVIQKIYLRGEVAAIPSLRAAIDAALRSG